MVEGRLATLVQPHLAPDETVAGAAVVWAARLGTTPTWLTGRHRHSLVLTDRRLLVFERRRHDDAPVVDERLEALTLDRTRRVLWFSQVVVEARGRRLLFEFRARDRATRAAFVTSLHARQPA
ncbi:MAG TPA: hypothetical protein VH986_08920 [Acidimicrobiia bacterium]|jgi:hypothetical protein